MGAGLESRFVLLVSSLKACDWIRDRQTMSLTLKRWFSSINEIYQTKEEVGAPDQMVGLVEHLVSTKILLW
jgi:hypothetical protein